MTDGLSLKLSVEGAVKTYDCLSADRRSLASSLRCLVLSARIVSKNIHAEHLNTLKQTLSWFELINGVSTEGWRGVEGLCPPTFEIVQSVASRFLTIIPRA